MRTACARFAGVAFLVSLGVVLAACTSEPEAPAKPELQLRAVRFEHLEGWSQDDPRAALQAFRRSCAKLDAQPDDRAMARNPTMASVAGDLGAWRGACAAAGGQDASAEQARAFFEDWFQPYLVTDRGEPAGLFTGYYEPLLHGSRHFGGRYTVPLYSAPDDLIRVDLGRFKPEFAGQTITGRVDGDQFVPYYARAEIDDGALLGRDLELVWVDDPVDKFFLQIQGSGQILLEDGSLIRVGYAGQNGHEYHAIGRDLVALGALSLDEVSLQSIRDWLNAHPEQAQQIMERNESYVFFRERAELSAADGPVGAQGVPLTPGRSLAVDRDYVPLGAPVWLETTAPWPEGDAPLRRLLIAQDTGGAIEGPVRGDVFFGAGERAEAVAGRMKSRGRYAVLLPKAAVPTS